MVPTFPLRCLALLSLAAATVHAHAEEATRPRVEFRSALQDYQSFSEEKQLPWKQANETVRQIGGWREYAREAAPAAPSTAPAKQGEGKADPHRGHHTPPRGSTP
jgi:hypothetical protein